MSDQGAYRITVMRQLGGPPLVQFVIAVGQSLIYDGNGPYDSVAPSFALEYIPPKQDWKETFKDWESEFD